MSEPPNLEPRALDLITGRLSDFFAQRTPWHRRLWSIGTVLGLREVVEYADGCLSGSVPNTEGLRYVLSGVRRQVSRDPGVAHLAAVLEGLFVQLDVSSPSKVPMAAREELAELTRRADGEYLKTWMTSPGAVEVEFAARAIAAHLLDAGFSSDHLFRWLQARGPAHSTLPDLLADLAAMAERMPVKAHEVFVPCAAPFDKPTTSSRVLQWLDGPAATAWLESRVPDNLARRESAGFVLTVQERDPWAAVESARALIARADARVRVAHPSNQTIRLAGWARIAGSGREYPMPITPRQVEIGSLYRQKAIYQFDDSSSTGIDDALELASYMESPSTGAAITGGWSAIEGLLIRPGEGSHHLAADRLAALVACSLPRAEMTSLAYRHVNNGNDDLAAALSSVSTNFERVRLVEDTLRGGGRLALTDRSDVAAQNRVVEILRAPAAELERIRTYTTESLRRLYNQRNMVVHAGSLQSLVLPATIRTAFSLVGAGLDRIVHAQLETQGRLQPLSLVARAETELRLLGTDGARLLGELLN